MDSNRCGTALTLGGTAFLLGNLLAGCCLMGSGTRCVEFEDQAVGTLYDVGDSFVDSGVTMTLGDYQWPDGSMTSGGHARVDGDQNSGGTGNDLNLNNITVAFDFGTVGGLTLLYGEYGGTVNLEVNSDLRNVGGLAELDGMSVGGVAVAVTSGPVIGGVSGVLTLAGTIESVSIGGQELWIDHVCVE